MINDILGKAKATKKEEKAIEISCKNVPKIMQLKFINTLLI